MFNRLVSQICIKNGLYRSARSVNRLHTTSQCSCTYCNGGHGGATDTGGNSSRRIDDVLKYWCKTFTEKKISEPLESIANILACAINSKNIGDVYKHRHSSLSNDQVNNVSEMCQLRLQKVPVQYILGEWDFRDITLKLSPPVFIPRPETELLVELVLNEIKTRKISKVLEFCCGSGAISLALLHQIPKLQVVAVDKCEKACALTDFNAKMLGLSDRILINHINLSDDASLKVIADKYDLIVSNPPYILSGDMKNLQPEILLYEDLDALDGGADGLNIVKQILKLSSTYLNLEGKLFLEVDPSHPPVIHSWLGENKHLGLEFVSFHLDLCNEPRFVEIIKI